MTTIKKQKPRLIAALELAQMIGTSVRTVMRYRADGRLPAAVDIAGLIRWRLTDIEQWLELGCPDQKSFDDMVQAAGDLDQQGM